MNEMSSRQEAIDIVWRAVIAGLLGGAALILLLTPQVFFADDTTYTVSYGLTLSILPAGILTAVMVLVISVSAVLWSQPQDARGKLLAGIVAGAVMGVLLFGGVGAPVAGVYAQSPLYGVAISRVGYASDSEWLVKLTDAVNATHPATYGIFWGLVLGGALIGGVVGLLTPVRLTTASPPESSDSLWFTAILAFTVPALVIITLVNLAMMPTLAQALQKNYDEYGMTPGWTPAWSGIAAVVQSWLLLTVIQLVSLRWLSRLPESRFNHRPGAVAFILGGFGIMGAVISALTSDTLGIITGVVTLVLSGGMMFVGRRVWLRARAASAETLLPLSRVRWAAAGAVGGLLAAAVGSQLIAASLNLVLVSVVMIVELVETDAPPPGLDWLRQTIAAVFPTCQASFTMMLLIFMGVSALIGWALASFPRQRTNPPA